MLVDSKRVEKELKDARTEWKSRRERIYKVQKTWNQIEFDGWLAPLETVKHELGSSLWPLYVRLPLNKVLFNQVVTQLEKLGWTKKDSVKATETTVSVDMYPSENMPGHGMYQIYISVFASFYNGSTGCKLVEIAPAIPAQHAVYEWICEEGETF